MMGISPNYMKEYVPMVKELKSEELRSLATEIVDKMTTQERAELLEWVKNEFPRFQNNQ